MSRTILNRYELLLKLPGDQPEHRWLARTDRGVAVKVIEIPSDIAHEKEYLRLYHGYSRRAALLGHPGVAATYESNVDGEAYYVVTELVRGETLEDVLRRASQFNRRLDLATVLAIVGQVAEALHAAHVNQDNTGKARGVIHGELGPDRVMVTYDGALKVIDLPIATASRSVRTSREGQMSGRLDYLSPEQCMGESPDARSNVFTLGVMLWELLTGQRLYGRGDAFDVMQAICDEKPTPPSRYNPEIPPFLDALVVKVLGKKPESRLSDCSQLARSLRNVAARLDDSPEALGLELLMVELFSERSSTWNMLARAEQGGDVIHMERAARQLFMGEAQASDRQNLAATAEMDSADEFAVAALRSNGLDEGSDLVIDGAIEDALSFLDSELSSGSDSSWAPPGGTAASIAPTSGPSAFARVGAGGDSRSADELAPEDETVTQTMTDALAQDIARRDQAPTSVRDVDPIIAESARRALEDRGAEDPTNVRMAPTALREQADRRDDLGDQRPPVQSMSVSADAYDQGPEAFDDAEPTTEFRADMMPGAADSAPAMVGAEDPAPAEQPAHEPVATPAPAPAPTPEVRRPRPAPTGDDARMAWYFGDDEGPDDGFVSSFSIDEIVGEVSDDQPGMKAGAEVEPNAVLEVIRYAGSRVVEQVELRGSKKYAPPGAAFAVKRSGARASVDPGGATGWVRPKNAQQSQRVEGGAFEMGVGDMAEVSDGVFTYRMRFFHPPMAPQRMRNQRPGRIIALFAVAGVASLFFHVGAMLGFYAISQRVELTVKPAPPTKELFAEGKLEDLKKKVAEKPKPKPKPKPKRPKPKKAKITEKRPADPTEQKPKVPKAVSKKLSKRLNTARKKIDRSASEADQLAAALSSPVAGEGTTVKDVVTNMDAIKNTGSASAAMRVAGTLSGIEGDAPSIATGGGGKVGDLSKGVAGGVGKLEKRKGAGSGKVRGKVRAVKALSKVQGNISRGDVFKEINKHLGRIQLCYERELSKNPKLAGKINFEWVIKTNGRVSNVREKSSTLRSAKASSCIKGVIKKMKFVKPKGGSVTIVYPFMFQSR